MKLTTQIICDILKNGMKLDADQIWIYNQRRAIPEDKRLYITVGMLSMKPYANNNSVESSSDGMNDTLSQYLSELISIDLMSYSTEAVERFNEVLGSLHSTYSQQVQELNALKISLIPTTMNDVSAIEGATILYRIAFTLPVLRKYAMLLSASYYDTITPGYVALTEQ